MNAPTLSEWLADQPFALALSSGFFGFFAHCGFLKALEERGLKPHRLTGASAGALASAAIASGLSALELEELLLGIRREDFWDPRPGFGLLRGEKFLRLLEKHLVPTFAHVTIPFEAAVYEIFSHDTRFIGEGPLPRAVVASCSVPLLFPPVRIDGTHFWDGGVLNKSAIRPQDRDERLLCSFLAEKNWLNLFERRKNIHDMGPEHRVLRFNDLPKVHPFALGEGKAALEDAYARTKRALDQPLVSAVTEL